ncbi:MAG: cytochrome c-type biogenesis CcmF C-terminal domain-containing protein, partial [Alphaproteobacteria bacterium]
ISSWRDAVAALGVGLGVWVIAGAFLEWAARIQLFRLSLGDSLRRAFGLPRNFYGMSIAHGALGIVVLGITASSAWQTEIIKYMRPGDRAQVAAYTLIFEGVRELRGPNYVAERGIFRAEYGGAHVTVLEPEKRRYPVEGNNTTEAAIHTTFMADLYVVLGDADGRGGWAVRAYHNPLVPWIWGGAILMFLGGLVSLSDRRHRVGAPRRSAAGEPAPVAA